MHITGVERSPGVHMGGPEIGFVMHNTLFARLLPVWLHNNRRESVSSLSFSLLAYTNLEVFL